MVARSSSTMPRQMLQVALLLAVAVAVCGGAQPLREVRPQDVDAVLKNDFLLNTFIRCLLEKGPCTPDGKQLRRLLPETLQSGCEKCSANHREQSEKVIRFLIKRRAGDWRLLAAKYDPNGEYELRYGSELSN